MPKPLRSPSYRAWVRTLPCIVCYSGAYLRYRIEGISEVQVVAAAYPEDHRAPSQFAHSGGRGISQKACDFEGLPICFLHHDRQGAPDAQHRIGKRFFEHHGLDRLAIIRALHAEFRKLHPVAARRIPQEVGR